MVVLLLSVLAAACGAADEAGVKSGAATANGAAPTPTAQRGGTITIGEENWRIVPAIQCGVYPGDVVSVAGHAAEDSSLEIVIDHSGPDQVVVGSGMGAWRADSDTIQIEIDGKRVRGTATFTRLSNGTREARQGSFDLSC